MISRASSTLRCNDIRSLTLSISSIYASSISWFIQFRVDTTVVGLVCLYTVLAFLTTLSIEYPLEIEHVIPVVRYLPPFILDIDDFHVPPFLSSPLARYICICISHTVVVTCSVRACETASLQRYPLPLPLPLPPIPSLDSLLIPATLPHFLTRVNWFFLS